MDEETKRILDEHGRRINELENILKGKKEVPVIEGTTGIQKLATKLGIPTDKFNQIFDKEESTLTVIKYTGANDREKTQNIALLTLLGYKIFFGQEEVLSQEIRRNVAENSVALNNFGTYLNEIAPSLLRRKGELRSPKTTYRLTVSGEVKAKELIKNILDLTKG